MCRIENSGETLTVDDEVGYPLNIFVTLYQVF